jgi:hypothetical protein
MVIQVLEDAYKLLSEYDDLDDLDIDIEIDDCFLDEVKDQIEDLKREHSDRYIKNVLLDLLDDLITVFESMNGDYFEILQQLREIYLKNRY